MYNHDDAQFQLDIASYVASYVCIASMEVGSYRDTGFVHVITGHTIFVIMSDL